MPITQADADRFWSKVERTDSCWLWTASVGGHGYGQIKIAGRIRTAHRVAYKLAKGAIPDGYLIDHTCMNKRCVNPEHLRLATAKQNAEHRSARGTGRSGVRGVVWDKARGAWCARVTHNYRTINVGRFASVDDAAAAAAAARLVLFTHNNADRILS